MGDVSFLNTVKNLLETGDTTQVLILFRDEKNKEEICKNSWDLIPIVAHYLNEETKSNNNNVFACCQKLLDLITATSKPDEILLQFIEEIETSKDDIKFLALLKPLENVLLRVPDNRITSLAWCFNAIKTYLLKLETPDDFSLNHEERLLLDGSPTVVRIINLYEEILAFSETFLKECMNIKDENVPRKEIIGKFLIELLGKPLAFLDMEMYKNTKSKARMIAEALVKKSSIIKDPYIFINMQGCDDGGDLIKPSDIALGVYYYLIIYEQISLETIPKVYNPIFVLHHSLKLITELITQECQFAVEKGVHLAAAVVKNINKQQLPYLLLDSEHHSRFCKMISNTIVHNESENVRKTSLQILHNYLWGFEHQGRYLIILNLIRTLGHSGLKGNLITQYKEMITEELRENDFKIKSKYYKGRKLFDLLHEFTYLKQKEETDLVDESDQIVSTLNLLRYLMLVDKNGCSEIDSYLITLEEGYFKYLKTGIDLSKEHYLLKIREINEETKSDCEVSVKVSGKNLMEMPTEKKIEIMNLSLTTLDVVDSLLSRVMECLRARKSRV